MSRYSIDFIKATTDVPFTPNGYLLLFGEVDVAIMTELAGLGASTLPVTE